SSSELRSYLKSMSRDTWKYVSWLTHAKDARPHDGEMGVRMVAHFLSLFEQAIERRERGGPDRCPSCSSYRIARDEAFDMEDWTATRRRLCEACGWSEEYEPEPLGPPPPPSPPPQGDCIP